MDNEVSKICFRWLTNQIYYNGLIVITALCIVGINKSIEISLKYLSSKYEKHNNLNDEYVSRILKTFFALSLSTGLIYVIQNSDFSVKKNSFLLYFFGGTEHDFTIPWFKYVGGGIVIIYVLTFITEPILELIENLYLFLKRCQDRDYSCNHKLTRKYLFKHWVKLYLGPEFNIDLRYA